MADELEAAVGDCPGCGAKYEEPQLFPDDDDNDETEGGLTMQHKPDCPVLAKQRHYLARNFSEDDFT